MNRSSNLVTYLLAGVVGVALGAGLASLYYYSRTNALQVDLNRLRVEAGNRERELGEAQQKDTRLAGQLDEQRAEMNRLAELARAARERAERLTHEFQEYRSRPHLRVVRGGDRTPIQITREEGERDLMYLAITSDVEDAWTYYEKDGKCYWVNVGIDEREDGVTTTLFPELMRGAHNITDYHIQPASSVFGRVKEDFRKKQVSDREFLDQIFGNLRIYYFYLTMPSLQDYSNNWSTKHACEGFDGGFHPSIVVSPGIFFEYDTTDELDRRVYGPTEDVRSNAVAELRRRFSEAKEWQTTLTVPTRAAAMTRHGFSLQFRVQRSPEIDKALLEQFKSAK